MISARVTRVALAGLIVLLAAATVATAQEPPADGQFAPVYYRPSRAVGTPSHGKLRGGVQLPDQGADFFTWDGLLRLSPSRPWRRWGTSRLIRTVLGVAAEYRAANPGAPRLCIEDMSRPRGGDFGARFGGLGHASHQNGLDVDIGYPRLDREELGIFHPWQIDRALAQDLVDRFVAAGAEYVFVGPRTKLDTTGPVVAGLIYHDDHMHVRIRKNAHPTAPTA